MDIQVRVWRQQGPLDRGRMVSYDVRRSKGDLWRYARTMALLEAEVPFDPEKFALPNSDELANRHRKGAGRERVLLHPVGGRPGRRAGGAGGTA